MAIGVLILGESGSGKSYSMRNLSPDEVKVISVEKPILPFKNHFDVTRTNDVERIVKELKETDKKIAVIDDFQYILGLAAMRRSLEKGWDKFSEMQFDYFTVLDALKTLPDDMIVYFMSHTETDENGNMKIKTIGKALDKYITIEGMFMIVLGTKVSDGKYYFTTQNSGKDTVKSPAGMFPSYAIDNDLKYVDEKIRNYYEIGEFLTDEEMKEIDDIAKRDDIPINDGKKKRGRRSAKKEEPAETSAEEKKEETERISEKAGAGGTDSEGNPGRTKRGRRKKTDNTTSDESTESVVDEQIHGEDVEEESFRGEDEAADGGSVESVPRTRKRKKKSREEVAAENEQNIVNANVDESGEKDEIPYDEAEEPEVEKLPRRSRKDRSQEEAMTPPEEPEEQEKPRRRRRRA
ncbi:MAG: hypothetical protein ACI4WG_05290 [Erysipelotrichaceae bacterium]